MRALIVFFLFIVLAYISGAILAYPLMLALDPFLDLEYRKYINYATLLAGIGVSALYLKACGTLSRQAFGFSGPINEYFRVLARGFCYGIVIILIIEAVLYSLDIHELDPRRSYSLDVLALRLVKALLSGLAISLLEETIFRGGLFAGLHRKAGVKLAVVVSSLLYSAVHFIRYRDMPEGMEPGWLTGLAMMPDAFRRFYQWSILDYFLTLFMFGVLLALLRLRHNTLAGCIGLHAGVVATIKIADYYGQRTNDSQYEYLVSPYNSTFGWFSFGVLLIVTVLYYARTRKQT